jgi:hypothetical protein
MRNKNISKPKILLAHLKDLKPAPELKYAETDSSQTINLGCNAIVLAIPFLCPPENSCGYLLKYSAPKPTLSRISIWLFFLSLSYRPCTFMGSIIALPRDFDLMSRILKII